MGGRQLALGPAHRRADRAVLIAPPFRTSNRWLRYAERLEVPEDIAFAAQQIYEERIGPDRAAFDVRAALRRLDVDLLLIHSADDERASLSDSQDVVALCRRAELLVVEGLSHRRTARDPEVVARIADFVD